MRKKSFGKFFVGFKVEMIFIWMQKKICLLSRHQKDLVSIIKYDDGDDENVGC